MRFDVITLFPELFAILKNHGVTGRALQRGLIDLMFWNPRDYTDDIHRKVDDRPYGGGPGMVMQFAPLKATITAARLAAPASQVIYLSPQGNLLNQDLLSKIAQQSGWILIAGRYEGVDERLLESEIDAEWSIGDYILSGGELAIMVILDAVIRLIPGALGHPDSAQQDSYTDRLLDYPQYTRPAELEDGSAVPEVLLSGDHAAIARWRSIQSLGRTWLRRPELLIQRGLTAEEQMLLTKFFITDLHEQKFSQLLG